MFPTPSTFGERLKTFPSSQGKTEQLNEDENHIFRPSHLTFPAKLELLEGTKRSDVVFYLDLPQEKLLGQVEVLGSISCHGASAPSALPNLDKCSPTAGQTAPVLKRPPIPSADQPNVICWFGILGFG